MTRNKSSCNPSELSIALENRAFEIQLFWQRSNYFMALMTALGIGVFAIKEPFYALTISIFAAITSWFWYKTNLGSKFWHESWEVEVVLLAKELKIRSFEKPTSDVKEQVRNSLQDANLKGDRTYIKRWIDKQIVKKPSVSHYMILLSLTSTAMWSIIAGSLATDLIRSKIQVQDDTKPRMNASRKSLVEQGGKTPSRSPAQEKSTLTAPPSATPR